MGDIAQTEGRLRHGGRTRCNAAVMFLNILVAVDGSPSSRRAVEQAVDLARAMNSILTLVAVAPPAPPYVAFASVSPEQMKSDVERWAGAKLEEAAELVPDDVLVHRVQRGGHVGPEIVAELERGHYDLVVLGTRGRGRAQESLLGSVNGYLHFHAHVPVLSVPEDE